MKCKYGMLWAAALSFVTVTASCLAEIRLPKMLSDHSVLQRDRPIHVWGWATPGAALVVTMHGQRVAATANSLGEWSASLMPESAGGPYVLTVTGNGDEGTKSISDVLIGDVWLASGQSNMEMPLNGFPPGAVVKDAAREIASANQPKVRLLFVDHKASEFPVDDVSHSWTECTPETAAKFSAVAYFFGREISNSEHVPIGLIDTSWGGTPADSWVSLDRLGSDPALLPAFRSRARFTAGLASERATIAAEQREDEAAKAEGRAPHPHPWHPAEESWTPAALYNGMIAPFTKYTIKGFLWYQGETNSGPDRALYYKDLFAGLIEDWRTQFAQGDLPFLYVQISSFSSPGENWPLVRDAQRRVLMLRNTAMAVTMDVGDPHNVHPPDKQTVGARLALAAHGMVYGEQVEYASPLFRQATTEQGGMRVWFDHAKGLTARGGTVEGFELAGADHHFVPARATIDGESVRLASDLAAPMYVRYAWTGVAPRMLFNAANLPASPFTSEDMPQR